MRFLPVGVFLVAAATACGEDNVDDPDAAKSFLTRLQGENYRGWSRAPGWEARKGSIAAHGDDVDIYVNKTVSEVKAGASAWPEGAVIVKDSFRGGSVRLIAAMEKRSGGWYYAEWAPDGEPKYAGRPQVCLDCHSNGQDEVLAFGLPK